jgi:hypothetical protein
MPALIDAALAVLVLVGAFFLGTIAMALFRELTKGKNDDDKKSN